MKDMIDIQAVCEFEGGPYPIWYMARGHIDKTDFVAACNAEFGTEFTADDVSHEYAHNQPVGPDRPGEYVIVPYSSPGRGRYKVTVINIAMAQRDCEATR